MTSRFLAGVAGAALIVAAGAANAADVPPLGAEATVAGSGTKVSVAVESGLFVGVNNFSPPFFAIDNRAGIDVRFASGFGVTLFSEVVTELQSPPVSFVILGGRVYKSFGAFEVGFGGSFLTGIAGYEFGPDVRYETDRLTIVNATSFGFFFGTFDRWENETTVTFNPNDRIEVFTYVEVEGGPGFPVYIDVANAVTITVAPHFEVIPNAEFGFDTTGGRFFGAGVEARFPLGVLTPYTSVFWSPTNDFINVNLGFDLEKPIGATPLSLIGGANYGASFTPGFPTFHSFDARIGLRYLAGDDPPDLSGEF
ncbi:MAG: hypothetical protein KIS96_01275 [Bauldia sp.]|nr:hypothetical protein [Bauldia sp.]